MKPLLYHFYTSYCKQILNYHGLDVISESGSQFKIKGFEEYNFLIDINRIFSDSPDGDIVDRSNTIKMPINWHLTRNWSSPVPSQNSLEEILNNRVLELCSSGKKINLLWSGGIDSTGAVVAFLKNCKNLNQLRVLYSTFSIKENAGFFLLLQQYTEIELLEISGDWYIDQNIDGIFITGDPNDDLTASIDESFFRKIGKEGFSKSWKNYFFKQNKNSKFMDFCEKFYSIPGNIETVLDARWWFYVNTKIQKFPAKTTALLNQSQGLALGFYDFDEYEHYMFFNKDIILPRKNYATYKQFIKDYIYNFDKNLRYQKYKRKENSLQVGFYYHKKMAVTNNNYILLLGDGSRIRTKCLPLLSEKEYRSTYVNSLDYLFNTP